MEDLRKSLARRSKQVPIIPGISNRIGIDAAMSLNPQLQFHLRGIAQLLFVEEWEGATVTKAEREAMMTFGSVVAYGDHNTPDHACHFCSQSHAAFTLGHLNQENDAPEDNEKLIQSLLTGNLTVFSQKMQSLFEIVRITVRNPLTLTKEHLGAATTNGATETDINLAWLIGSMATAFNRMVDAPHAATPDDVEAYRYSVDRIITQGYLPKQAK